MNSDNLKYVLRQFADRRLPACRPREIVLPTGTGKVIGLVGVRRSGKTFLFFHTIRRLTEEGVDRRCIVYLNFEDDRLHPIRAEELDLVCAAATGTFTTMPTGERSICATAREKSTSIPAGA